MRLDMAHKFALAFLAVAAVGAGLPTMLEHLGLPVWGAFFCALLMGSWLGWIYARQITSNFQSLRGCAERIGQGDLTADVDIHAGRRFPDETVDLARSVDAMLQNLRELVEHIQRAADDVAQSSREVSGSVQGLKDTGRSLVESMDGVANGASQQESDVEQIANRVREIAVALRSNADSAHEASAAAAEVSRRATGGVAVSRRSAAKLQDLFGEVERTADVTQEFDERIRAAQRVTEMIFSIVEKAHLLSLNASIEAARAGEAGRGFSVVAEEIRKLAENAGLAGEQIEELMSQLDAEARRISKATRGMGRTVKEGRDDIDELFRVLEQVQYAIEETSKRAESIFRQSSGQAASMEQLVLDVEGVASLVGQGAKHADEMRRSLNEQVGSVGRMVGQAGRLSEMSVRLEKVARRFRTR